MQKTAAAAVGLLAMAMLGGAIGAAGCSADSGGSAGGATTRKLRVRLVAPPTKAADESAFGSSAAALSGQNGAAGLESLRFAIRNVSICRSLTPQGTGFSNPTGCISVYDGPRVPELEYDPNGDLTGLAAAARANDAPFVDLATAAGRAAITGTHEIMTSEIGEYQYGIITWYPPIKFQSSVNVDATTTLRTRDGVTSSRLVGADGYRQYLTTASAPLASAAPSELAVVLLPNGGNWFKFQTPLTIGSAAAAAAADAGSADGGADAGDVGTGEFIDVDLVFDAEALVSAFTANAGDSPRVCLVDGTGAGFDVPMLDLAPIVRTDARAPSREDWVADLGGGVGYRLSLYGVTPDANRRVYGVLSRSVMTAANVVPREWFNAPKIARVELAADGTLAFAETEGPPVVRGFRRTPTEATTGATVSAEVRCTGHDERPSPHGFFLPGCATGTYRAVTFTAR